MREVSVVFGEGFVEDIKLAMHFGGIHSKDKGKRYPMRMTLSIGHTEVTFCHPLNSVIQHSILTPTLCDSTMVITISQMRDLRLNG